MIMAAEDCMYYGPLANESVYSHQLQTSMQHKQWRHTAPTEPDLNVSLSADTEYMMAGVGSIS